MNFSSQDPETECPGNCFYLRLTSNTWKRTQFVRVSPTRKYYGVFEIHIIQRWRSRGFKSVDFVEVLFPQFNSEKICVRYEDSNIQHTIFWVAQQLLWDLLRFLIRLSYTEWKSAWFKPKIKSRFSLFGQIDSFHLLKNYFLLLQKPKKLNYFITSCLESFHRRASETLRSQRICIRRISKLK